MRRSSALQLWCDIPLPNGSTHPVGKAFFAQCRKVSQALTKLTTKVIAERMLTNAKHPAGKGFSGRLRCFRHPCQTKLVNAGHTRRQITSTRHHNCASCTVSFFGCKSLVTFTGRCPNVYTLHLSTAPSGLRGIALAFTSEFSANHFEVFPSVRKFTQPG